MSPYLPILLLFSFAALFVATFLFASSRLGPRRSTREKLLPYECGIDSEGAPREAFPVKFYLVAMLFIIFDIEVVFLFPWAVLFREFVAKGEGLFLFVEMMLFLGVIGVGLLYLYGTRALDWD